MYVKTVKAKVGNNKVYCVLEPGLEDHPCVLIKCSRVLNSSGEWELWRLLKTRLASRGAPLKGHYSGDSETESSDSSDSSNEYSDGVVVEVHSTFSRKLRKAR
ncbi:unnamed protein product [Rhizophagus irregularis]|nr:unnamed protein product [Rhizophagus irregularis]